MVSTQSTLANKKGWSKDQPHTRVWLWFLCSFLGVLLLPLQAQAQDVELTAEQRKLNNEAVIALKNDQSAKALQLIQAALQLGPKGNLLYLTLGRIHQKRDDCKLAKISFKQAVDAPNVKGITKEILKKKIDQYESEVGQLCSAHLRVTCKDPQTQVYLDEKKIKCESTLKLKPGTHTLQATLGQASEKQVMDLSGGQERIAKITLTATKTQNNVKNNTQNNKQNNITNPPETVPSEGFPFTKTALAGAATAVVSTGLWIWYASAREQGDAAYTSYLASKTPEEAETHRKDVVAFDEQSILAGWVATGVTIAGVAATAGMFVWELQDMNNKSAGKKDETGARISPVVSPDSVGVQMMWRW